MPTTNEWRVARLALVRSLRGGPPSSVAYLPREHRRGMAESEGCERQLTEALAAASTRQQSPPRLDPKGEQFGEARFLEAIESSADTPLKESLALIEERLENWCGSAGFKDDVSLLALQIQEASSDTLRSAG